MELDILISILFCVCYHYCQIAESTNEDHISQLSKRGKKLTFFPVLLWISKNSKLARYSSACLQYQHSGGWVGGLGVPSQPWPYSETLPWKEFARVLQSEILHTDLRLSELVSIDFSRITSNWLKPTGCSIKGNMISLALSSVNLAHVGVWRTNDVTEGRPGQWKSWCGVAGACMCKQRPCAWAVPSAFKRIFYCMLGYSYLMKRSSVGLHTISFPELWEVSLVFSFLI